MIPVLADICCEVRSEPSAACQRGCTLRSSSSLSLLCSFSLLSGVCSSSVAAQYLLGPTQKEGAEMSAEEQRRVFGVQLTAEKQTIADPRIKKEQLDGASSSDEESAAFAAGGASTGSFRTTFLNRYARAVSYTPPVLWPLRIGGREAPAESTAAAAAEEGDGEGEQLEGDGDGISATEVEAMLTASDEEEAEPSAAAATPSAADEGPADMEF